MSEIKIKNTLNKPLKKEYQIAVPYSLIDQKINSRITEVQKNYRLDGFRKGQVPAKLIKEKYEHSLMAEESEKIIGENSKKIIDENKLKLALSPKIDIKTFELKKDFEYTATFELFPEVPEINLEKIKLVKREVEVSKADIDEAVSKVLKNYRKWNKQEESYVARNGDAVNIDYLGKIDKTAFEGGEAKGYQLELGSKSFIDNFEEQLVGKKAGQEVKVKVKFPKEYHKEEFAGKAAEFEVKVNFVLKAENPELNDEFFKNNFGIDNITKLEEIARKQIESNYNMMTRNLFKKELFDFLNKKYDFDLPQGLVDEQFDKVWAGVEEEIKYNPNKFKSPKEQEKAKDKERKVAERMVRSGIILSNISDKNKITVSQNDLMQEVNKKLAEFPGQEKMVAEYYQKNPEAVQNLRGIILEDKAINLILEKSSPDIKKLSVKDFDKLSEKLLAE